MAAGIHLLNAGVESLDPVLEVLVSAKAADERREESRVEDVRPGTYTRMCSLFSPLHLFSAEP